MENKMEIRERLLQAEGCLAKEKIPEPIAIVDFGGTSPIPSLCRLTHATILAEGKEKVLVNTSERQLVLDILDTLYPYQNGSIVGYNLLAYDLPVLRNRVKANSINLRYWFKTIIDVRQIINKGNPYCCGRLKDFGEILGVAPETSGWLKRHHVLHALAADLPGLHSFLMADCRATYKLFLFLSGQPRAAQDQ